MVVAGLFALAYGQELVWVGVLRGTASGQALTPNGGTVVGWGENASFFHRAFRWRRGLGMEELGTLGGNQSYAYGVSGSGDEVVGWSRNSAGNPRAFLWTPGTGFQDIGTLGGSDSWAYGISWDGGVIVGMSEVTGGGAWHAFRFRRGQGMEDLGTLGGRDSLANAVSADGSVVVGRAHNPQNQRRAFRWSSLFGMEDLGTLGGFGSEALGVSPGGEVVVGWANPSSQRQRAFRWTREGGMEDLGTLGGLDSIAYAVSADGNIVVGTSLVSSGGYQAFRWVRSHGMENLNATYASLLSPGSVLSFVYGMSPDGRFMVGTGYNGATSRTEPFLLDAGTLPGSLAVERGLVLSGDVSSLRYSDDNWLTLRPWIVLSAFEPPVRVVLEGTSLLGRDRAGSLRVLVESSVNTFGIRQFVEAFDFSRGEWVEIGAQLIPLGDTRLSFVLPDAPSYISEGGALRLRVSYRPDGPVLLYPWIVRLDEVSWLVLP